MGSLLFLTQESIKQILSRATRIQKIQGWQEDLDQTKSLAIKIRQFKARAKNEDGQQIPPQLWVSLVMDKEYMEIILGGI